MSFCTKLVQHSRAILNTQINDFVLNMILVDEERQVIQRQNFSMKKCCQNHEILKWTKISFGWMITECKKHLIMDWKTSNKIFAYD